MTHMCTSAGKCSRPGVLAARDPCILWPPCSSLSLEHSHRLPQLIMNYFTWPAQMTGCHLPQQHIQLCLQLYIPALKSACALLPLCISQHS